MLYSSTSTAAAGQCVRVGNSAAATAALVVHFTFHILRRARPTARQRRRGTAFFSYQTTSSPQPPPSIGRMREPRSAHRTRCAQGEIPISPLRHRPSFIPSPNHPPPSPPNTGNARAVNHPSFPHRTRVRRTGFDKGKRVVERKKTRLRCVHIRSSILYTHRRKVVNGGKREGHLGVYKKVISKK